MEVSIKNTTKRATPTLSYQDIKDSILGKKYELSLVFCGNTLSRRLNRTFRGKDKPTNVLSFPLTKSSGEIFINLSQTRVFSVAELFVHGLLHLKGMEHGRTMDQAEAKFLKKFYIL